jgi:hypothetical protein
LISFERQRLISRNSRQLVVNRERVEGFLAQTHFSAPDAKVKNSLSKRAAVA